MEHAFKIRTIDHQRQVVPADGGFITRAHAGRAQFTLEMLERRVVLQAVGRIRPFTTPADIVLFRMDDLSEKLGDVETHDTLATARQAWGVPTNAELTRSALGDAMRADRDAGMSYGALAERNECSVSTAHKAIASPSLDDLLNGIKR